MALLNNTFHPEVAFHNQASRVTFNLSDLMLSRDKHSLVYSYIYWSRYMTDNTHSTSPVTSGAHWPLFHLDFCRVTFSAIGSWTLCLALALPRQSPGDQERSSDQSLTRTAPLSRWYQRYGPALDALASETEPKTDEVGKEKIPSSKGMGSVHEFDSKQVNRY